LKIGKGQLKECRVKHVWIHPEHSITCRKNNIKIDELYYRGRRRNVLLARAQAAHILIEDFGITLAEVARNLGVTTSAIFNMLKRKNNKFN
jgi:predicted DNA-binding protein YlxM (UPF0122 family)